MPEFFGRNSSPRKWLTLTFPLILFVAVFFSPSQGQGHSGCRWQYAVVVEVSFVFCPRHAIVNLRDNINLDISFVLLHLTWARVSIVLCCSSPRQRKRKKSPLNGCIRRPTCLLQANGAGCRGPLQLTTFLGRNFKGKFQSPHPSRHSFLSPSPSLPAFTL